MNRLMDVPRGIKGHWIGLNWYVEGGETIFDQAQLEVRKKIAQLEMHPRGKFGEVHTSTTHVVNLHIRSNTPTYGRRERMHSLFGTLHKRNRPRQLCPHLYVKFLIFSHFVEVCFDCIKHWSLETNVCPVCRARFTQLVPKNPCVSVDPIAHKVEHKDQSNGQLMSFAELLQFQCKFPVICFWHLLLLVDGDFIRG